MLASWLLIFHIFDVQWESSMLSQASTYEPDADESTVVQLALFMVAISSEVSVGCP